MNCIESVNPKEEFKNAIECKASRKSIPLWELEFHLWNKFSSKKFYVGEDFTKLTSVEKDKALVSNAEIIQTICADFSFGAVTIPGGYWEIAPGHPAYWWLPDDYRIRQAAVLQKMIGENVMLIANTGGVMAMPSADNYVEFAISLCEEPEKIDKQAQQIFQQGIESVKRFADLGIQTFITASDIADNKGPFFNPEQMERFIIPYLTKWSEYVKAIGGLSILHSDGNLNLYIDKIADSGVNALQAIDPLAKMDIRAVKKQVGSKLCVCGNIDVGRLIMESPESIYAEVKALLEFMKDKPGFVLGASNAVQPEVPVENYLALVKAWKEFNECKKD